MCIVNYESVDQNVLKCDYSVDSHRAVLYCGAAYYAVQGLSLWVKSLNVTIPMKATEQFFPMVMCVMLYKV